MCRLGGDEFAVFVVDIDPSQTAVIENRFRKINKELEKAGDNLPSVSVSAGVAHGSYYRDHLTMVHDADEAVYRTKSNGKCGISFARNLLSADKLPENAD